MKVMEVEHYANLGDLKPAPSKKATLLAEILRTQQRGRATPHQAGLTQLEGPVRAHNY